MSKSTLQILLGIISTVIILQTFPLQCNAATIEKSKNKHKHKVPTALKPGNTFTDCSACPEMVMVPAGSFKMGSNVGGNEIPVHTVTFTNPFAIGKTEVTQGEWVAIMGSNPSFFSQRSMNHPVEQVSWEDTKKFIQRLNEKTGKQYRLPSEAEWEYACRAGLEQDYCGSDDIESIAWYKDPDSSRASAKSTHQVATKNANALGLYDMSGNVWEWTEDSCYSSYSGAPTDGSPREGKGVRRVLRGGSWDVTPLNLRSTNRSCEDPGVRENDVGFRLARQLP